MSFERYIELLQQLITMVEPENKEQVLNAKNILKNLMELADSSGMWDDLARYAMKVGYREFVHLCYYKPNFAGKPGDTEGNRAKRQRLASMLRPGC